MASIDSLKEKLSKLEASTHFNSLLPKNSGWFSRKLIVALAVIGSLIFIGRDNINLLFTGIITLGMTYIIVQGLNDIVHDICDAITRRKLIDAMAKDGISDEEAKTLSQK